MSQYLLSVYTAEGQEHREPPTQEQMQQMMEGVTTLEADMKSSGTFVFSARLHGSDAATVVRSGDGGPIVTDGPFVESKEHIAGFYIINADDLDAALAWADKVVNTIGAPIEVWPFVDTQSS
jgi:hypothetical protein